MVRSGSSTSSAVQSFGIASLTVVSNSMKNMVDTSDRSTTLAPDPASTPPVWRRGLKRSSSLTFRVSRTELAKRRLMAAWVPTEQYEFHAVGLEDSARMAPDGVDMVSLLNAYHLVDPVRAMNSNRPTAEAWRHPGNRNCQHLCVARPTRTAVVGTAI